MAWVPPTCMQPDYCMYIPVHIICSANSNSLGRKLGLTEYLTRQAGFLIEYVCARPTWLPPGRGLEHLWTPHSTWYMQQLWWDYVPHNVTNDAVASGRPLIAKWLIQHKTRELSGLPSIVFSCLDLPLLAQALFGWGCFVKTHIWGCSWKGCILSLAQLPKICTSIVSTYAVKNGNATSLVSSMGARFPKA